MGEYTRTEIMHSRSNMFSLCRINSIGINKTPYEGLEVFSQDLARKHVIEIRLNCNHPDFNGTPVTYTYYDAYISHGMRGEIDTLDDTKEYIEVLKEAVEFTEKINQYIKETY